MIFPLTTVFLIHYGMMRTHWSSTRVPGSPDSLRIFYALYATAAAVLYSDLTHSAKSIASKSASECNQSLYFPFCEII